MTTENKQVLVLHYLYLYPIERALAYMVQPVFLFGDYSLQILFLGKLEEGNAFLLYTKICIKLWVSDGD